ncbi:MAG: hypothetical protein K0U15_00960 [Proteobacteria bacterium]|nr:hypothetical protein [Pseudomonadota bacterium]
MSNLKLYTRGWRNSFERFLGGVSEELIVVTPYMRLDEANFTADCLRKDVRVRVLTDINDTALTSGALQAEAVMRLATISSHSSAKNLPRLHAKIYVADEKRAIISSANLTKGGLDNNFEYGVEIATNAVVANIRADISEYEKIGATVTIEQLQKIACAAETVHSKKTSSKKSKEEQILLQECLRLRVGERAPTAIFADALRYILLRSGGVGLTHKQIIYSVEEIYPDLCTEGNRIINDVRYGKLWKHHLRNAQQSLKKRGEIEYSAEKRWRLKNKK